MNLKKNPLWVAVAGLAAATAVPHVSAQDTSFAIEEVVVTARKRSENLQDVPIAISAIDEKTMERAGIERPADYISLIPNVTIVDTANVGDTQVSIRGIVSTRDAESTFAYVVDGVLSTNPNSFNEELLDVQQIEVLKARRERFTAVMRYLALFWSRLKNRATNSRLKLLVVRAITVAIKRALW